MASFVTTFFMPAFEQPTYYYWYSRWSPLDVAQDLVTATLRVLKDGNILEDPSYTVRTARNQPLTPVSPPGLIKRFIHRFLLGLPLVGAGSLVHMLLTVPYLGPIQWIARYRGGRSRRNNNSRDIAALIVVGLLIIGALRYLSLISSETRTRSDETRALYKVYQFTQQLTQRALLRAEDAILEVN
ncbi:hypothetical protein CVT26_014010 [Gymnopilus dilepis]|uniref:Uncharacterized protein n=1 Tax=Gymnopilus dilepis TaxID=231916 RepID=A0A409VW60_9AGAR|nr:hypothetical protein CVT26_014010 [Gymnopilus dilepis]